ncbi:hypothetical protein NliqN6_1336 [Naganishia liquefaciens]|uniref:Uncharacterized protein n=1 Tax=Naganishia liquefaciens TaxID=104408 RepID=A0A8H3TRH7_9TREE|nr:hypothetical protein NliqN6_1336 [Naganishia liquefaciens]
MRISSAILESPRAAVPSGPLGAHPSTTRPPSPPLPSPVATSPAAAHPPAPAPANGRVGQPASARAPFVFPLIVPGAPLPPRARHSPLCLVGGLLIIDSLSSGEGTAGLASFPPPHRGSEQA